MRWLGQGIRPSRSALYTFRDRLTGPIFDIHARAIRQAIGEGLTAAEEAVLDGTSIRSCASRHQLVNEEKLTKRLEELNAAVARDAAGQAVESRPHWMATTPDGRQGQLERYRQAGDRTRRAIGQEPGTSQGQAAAQKEGQSQHHRPGGTPGSRQRESLLSDVHGRIRRGYRIAADPVVRRLCSTDRCRDAAADARPYARGHRCHADSDQHRCRLYFVAGLAGMSDGGCPLGRTGAGERLHRTEASPSGQPRIGKDQFQWLPEEQTYRCPEGHRLEYKGREQKRRRDDQTVIQHRYHCPAEHCRACPLRERCVRDPRKVERSSDWKGKSSSRHTRSG